MPHSIRCTMVPLSPLQTFLEAEIGRVERAGMKADLDAGRLFFRRHRRSGRFLSIGRCQANRGGCGRGADRRRRALGEKSTTCYRFACHQYVPFLIFTTGSFQNVLPSTLTGVAQAATAFSVPRPNPSPARRHQTSSGTTHGWRYSARFNSRLPSSLLVKLSVLGSTSSF